MKKVLLAFDGQHFSEGAFEFARQMNEKEAILLTGVFLPQVAYANLWSYAESVPGPLFIPLVESEDVDAVQENITRFDDLCEKHHIEHRVHKDFFDFALPELKKETRYADLVILGSQKFYENLGISEPNDYLKDALHAAECPVVIVPEKFEFSQSNVLAYDGSTSSVFAIKQFSYLFPELAANDTLLVSAGENGTGFQDESYIKELASRHFSKLEMFKMELNPKKYFRTWISGKENAILVSGSFSRSAFSQLFRKSFVSEVIRDHKLPVFIAHR